MAGDRSTHDKEMASRMKSLGIRRTTARCPVCGRVISVDPFNHRDTYAHIAFRCAARGGEDE